MWMWIIPIFIAGLSIGSFLNVLIDRWPKNKSPFKGRSQCDHCRHTLKAIDLIPVVSFLFLKGRCRYCHKKLSIQYPIIETFTGLMFVGLFYFTFNSEPINLSQTFPFIYKLYFLSIILIFSGLVVIFVADVKYQVIPDEALVMLFFGSLVMWFTRDLSAQTIFYYLISGLMAAGFLGSVYLLTHGRGMGMGDVKYVLVAGLFLGPAATIVSLYLAFLTGGIISTILLLSKKKHLGEKIAFGPFLVIGTTLAFFQGDKWLNWFLNFLI